MKVICSGMPKTGTKTLCSALRTLGYNVFDVEEQFLHMGEMLTRACNEGVSNEEFHDMFKNVDAATDVPACTFWEQLHQVFPDAKIVHMERDSEEAWMRSYIKQMEVGKASIFFRLLLMATPTGRRLYEFLISAWARSQFSLVEPSLFRSGNYNPMMARLRYREHNSHVRAVAPKKQTLIFNVKQGWEPLCEFLGVPVPSIPFPHRNKGGEIIDEMTDKSPLFVQIKRELLWVGGSILGAGTLLVLCRFL